jgi:transcriptional regulator with XRE-family HTH domain
MANYKNLSDPGEVLAQRRQDLALSQAELAKVLAYPSVNFISMMESGRSKVPIERSVEIAAALEIDAKWFVERVLRDRHPHVADVIFGT